MQGPVLHRKSLILDLAQYCVRWVNNSHPAVDEFSWPVNEHFDFLLSF